MCIQKIIKSVSTKQIDKAQKIAKQHYESGNLNSQMNMISFD